MTKQTDTTRKDKWVWKKGDITIIPPKKVAEKNKIETQPSKKPLS